MFSEICNEATKLFSGGFGLLACGIEPKPGKEGAEC